MEILRLILIVIGILLIIGIYLWGQWSQRKQRQATVLERHADAESAPGAAAANNPDGIALAKGDDSSTATPGDEAPTIIAMHLICQPDGLISGSSLFMALAKHGMELGEMDIFHCRVADEEEPIFSLANMVKPGTFRVSELESFATPGLVLFMQLPGPDAPMMAFETMVSVGQALADQFELTLCDARRLPLDQNGIAQMREQVRPYC